MCWLKRERRKAGIALAGILLLLILMVWVPVSVTRAYERASRLETLGTGTAQATPTPTPTIAAERANEELRKLQRDNERSFKAWVWNSGAAILSSLFSTLVIVVGALIGFRQWRGIQSAEREKRAQELFQSAVTGLGSDKEDAKTSGVANLRAFLRPGYEQYYTQIFDLMVANLRLPRTPNLLEDQNAPLSLTPLRQALINVFKEAFPLAHEELKKTNAQFDPRSLDATNVQLDNAFLWKANLKQVWMPLASLQKTDLSEAILREARLWTANLHEANLCRADLRKADLGGADLRKANLGKADLRNAQITSAQISNANLEDADLRNADLFETDLRNANNLRKANLSGAKICQMDLSSLDLREANLTGADLGGANLSHADLRSADLSRADLRGAIFSEADLSNAQLSSANLSSANLSSAKLNSADLSGANLRGADFSEAILDRTILRDAKYNDQVIPKGKGDKNEVDVRATKWPPDFDPRAAGAICVWP